MRVGCEMEIGEDRLAFAQQPELLSLELLHLHDQFGRLIDFGCRRGDLCARSTIVIVAHADALGCTRLNKHLVPMGDGLAHARRDEPDAILVNLYLFGNADTHSSLSRAVKMGRLDEKVHVVHTGGGKDKSHDAKGFLPRQRPQMRR